MALIKCKECDSEISEKAKTCPHCGVPKPKPKNIGCGTFILMGFLFFVFSIGSNIKKSG